MDGSTRPQLCALSQWQHLGSYSRWKHGYSRVKIGNSILHTSTSNAVDDLD